MAEDIFATNQHIDKHSGEVFALWGRRFGQFFGALTIELAVFPLKLVARFGKDSIELFESLGAFKAREQTSDPTIRGLATAATNELASLKDRGGPTVEDYLAISKGEPLPKFKAIQSFVDAAHKNGDLISNQILLEEYKFTREDEGGNIRYKVSALDGTTITDFRYTGEGRLAIGTSIKDDHPLVTQLSKAELINPLESWGLIDKADGLERDLSNLEQGQWQSELNGEPVSLAHWDKQLDTNRASLATLGLEVDRAIVKHFREADRNGLLDSQSNAGILATLEDKVNILADKGEVDAAIGVVADIAGITGITSKDDSELSRLNKLRNRLRRTEQLMDAGQKLNLPKIAQEREPDNLEGIELRQSQSPIDLQSQLDGLRLIAQAEINESRAGDPLHQAVINRVGELEGLIAEQGRGEEVLEGVDKEAQAEAQDEFQLEALNF